MTLPSPFYDPTKIDSRLKPNFGWEYWTVSYDKKEPAVEDQPEKKIITRQKFSEIVNDSWRSPQEVWQALEQKWYTLEGIDKYKKQVSKDSNKSWVFDTEPKSIFGGLISRFETVKRKTEERTEAFHETFREASKAEEAGKQTGVETFGQTILNAFWFATGLAFDVAVESIDAASFGWLKKLGKEAEEAIANLSATKEWDAIMSALVSSVEEYEEIVEKYPRAARNFEAAINVADMIPAGASVKWAKWLIKGTGRAIDAAADVASAWWKLKKIKAWFWEAVQKAAAWVDEAAEAARISKVDDVVSRVIQWEKKDIPKAVSALSTVDTQWVKSFDDLSSAISTQQSDVVRRLDDILLEDTAKYWVDDFSKVTSSPSWRSIKSNKLSEALDHLDEMYEKIWDDDSLLKVRDLKDKAAKEWISLKEANDVAREYNSQFWSKAFSKTWDPLTSVNSKKFENTRSWLKDAIRWKMDWDVAKALDQSYSNLQNTKRLVQDLWKKAQKAKQKLRQKWVGEKVVEGAFEIVDSLTLWAGSWVLRLLRGIWGKSKNLNVLDLEDMLSSNLKILDKLNKAKSKKGIKSQLEKLKEIFDKMPEIDTTNISWEWLEDAATFATAWWIQDLRTNDTE